MGGAAGPFGRSGSQLGSAHGGRVGRLPQGERIELAEHIRGVVSFYLGYL